MLPQANEWVKKKDKEKNIYYGVVIGREDPLKRNRVQIRIKELHNGVPDELIPFFRSKKALNSNLGYEVDVPPLGAKLEVEFEGEDFYNGVYTKGIPSPNEDSFFEGYPDFKGFKTASGNIFKLFDNGNAELILANGKSIKLTDGVLNLKGIHIITDSKVDINSSLEVSESANIGSDAVIGGISFVSHKHTDSRGGTTSTPF